MARWGAVLFAAGATLGVLSLLLPHGPQLDFGLAITVVAFGYAFAATLAMLGERMPVWVIHLALVAGVSTVAVGIHSAGTGRLAGSASVLYLWVVIFAAYYFSWAETAMYVVLVAFSYAAVLNIDHEPAWPERGPGTLETFRVNSLGFRSRRSATPASTTSFIVTP